MTWATITLVTATFARLTRTPCGRTPRSWRGLFNALQQAGGGHDQREIHFSKVRAHKGRCQTAAGEARGRGAATSPLESAEVWRSPLGSCHRTATSPLRTHRASRTFTRKGSTLPVLERGRPRDERNLSRQGAVVGGSELGETDGRR